MILFNQSTAVLHKYLNDKLKILCLLQFFSEAAQNSENSLSFHVQRNPWVFQVFQVCGNPVNKYYWTATSDQHCRPVDVRCRGGVERPQAWLGVQHEVLDSAAVDSCISTVSDFPECCLRRSTAAQNYQQCQQEQQQFITGDHWIKQRGQSWHPCCGIVTSTIIRMIRVLPMMILGDTVYTPGQYPKNQWVFGKIRRKKQQKNAPNLIQFVGMPVIIKDYFMSTASNDQ